MPHKLNKSRPSNNGAPDQKLRTARGLLALIRSFKPCPPRIQGSLPRFVAQSRHYSSQAVQCDETNKRHWSSDADL